MQISLFASLCCASLRGAVGAGISSRPFAPAIHTDILRPHFVPAICTSSLHQSFRVCALQEGGPSPKKRYQTNKPDWQKGWFKPVKLGPLEVDPVKLGIAPDERIERTSWMWQIPEKYRKDGAQRYRYINTWEENAKQWSFVAKDAVGEGGLFAKVKKLELGDMALRAKETAQVARLNQAGETAMSDEEKDYVRRTGAEDAWRDIAVAWERVAKSAESAKGEDGWTDDWTTVGAKTVAIASNRIALLATKVQSRELEKVAEAWKATASQWDETTKRVAREKKGTDELVGLEEKWAKEEEEAVQKKKTMKKGNRLARREQRRASRGFGASLFALHSKYSISFPAVALSGFFLGTAVTFISLLFFSRFDRGQGVMPR